MSIGVLIADDHEILRAGLRSLIETHPGYAVVAEAENGRTAVALARELRPQIVLMDISMPVLNGIEATRQIIAEVRETRVLGFSKREDVRSVARMLTAGAAGYVVKAGGFDEVSAALDTVSRGELYLSPRVAAAVIESLRDARVKSAAGTTPLTPREREVLQLLAEGYSTKEIANELGLSEKTVENHRRQMREKLDLHTTAELTKYAIREGLTEVDY